MKCKFLNAELGELEPPQVLSNSPISVRPLQKKRKNGSKKVLFINVGHHHLWNLHTKLSAHPSVSFGECREFN